jgi:hypothetical protein
VGDLTISTSLLVSLLDTEADNQHKTLIERILEECGQITLLFAYEVQMVTKTEKKNAIRQNIIDSAAIYSKNLAGKTFLYVYGENFFEVMFSINHFLHLTGVETGLSAKDFYKNAKKGKLSSNQFYFTERHPYANARKKLPCLKRLPELTSQMVCVLKDMQTATILYKLSVTNLEFTLGLTENIDTHGKKINDYFLPMSLRVEDSSVKKSKDGEIVDFIFAKDACMSQYNKLVVQDTKKNIPENIRYLIDAGFYHKAK